MNKINKIFTPVKMSIFLYVFVFICVLVQKHNTWYTFLLCMFPSIYFGIEIYFNNNIEYLKYELYLLKNDWENRKYLYY